MAAKWNFVIEYSVEESTRTHRNAPPSWGYPISSETDEDGVWKTYPMWCVVIHAFLTRDGVYYTTLKRECHHLPQAQYFNQKDMEDAYLMRGVRNDPVWDDLLSEPLYDEVSYLKNDGTPYRERTLNNVVAGLRRWHKAGRPMVQKQEKNAGWYIRQGLNSW